MKKVYLDYAAATPLSQECMEAMRPFFMDKFYNPSATYLAAKEVRKSVDDCRHRIASSVGARASEIIFTAGGTEANNLAIQGVMNSFPGGNIVTTAIEHDSVSVPAVKYPSKVLSVNKYGQIDLSELRKSINDSTVLVSVGYVNHEIGTIQNIKEISNLMRQIRDVRRSQRIDLPLYFHTDAAQAGCYLDLNVSRLGVDLMSVNGGKLYGPKQSGILYVKTGVQISPLNLGGGQEFSVRSGTENVAAIHGFSCALLCAQNARKEEWVRISELNLEFAKSLQKKIKNTQINSSKKHTSPHILNVTFSGMDNERLMMELDEKGIMVALGSACSASSEEPSRVLKAIGLNDDEAKSSLRFSFGRNTSAEDIVRVTDLLSDIVVKTNQDK